MFDLMSFKLQMNFISYYKGEGGRAKCPVQKDNILLPAGLSLESSFCPGLVQRKNRSVIRAVCPDIAACPPHGCRTSLPHSRTAPAPPRLVASPQKNRGSGIDPLTTRLRPHGNAG